MTKNKTTVKQAFKEFIWPRKKIVVLGLVLIILRSLAGLVLPYASKTLLDDVVPNQDSSALWFIIGTVSLGLLIASWIMLRSQNKNADQTT